MSSEHRGMTEQAAADLMRRHLMLNWGAKRNLFQGLGSSFAEKAGPVYLGRPFFFPVTKNQNLNIPFQVEWEA